MRCIIIAFSFIFISFNIATSCAAECPSDRDADVLIFGAGASGIAAAKTLYDNGITDVIVLEARSDSIGGRVRNTEFGGVQVELGSYWIQGIPAGEDTRNSAVNPLWTLANDPNCFSDGPQLLQGKIDDFINVVYDQDPTDPTGRYINATASFEELSEKYDAIVEGIENQSFPPNTPDISVRDALSRNDWKKENYNNTKLFDLVEWYGYDFCFAKSPDGSSLRWTIPTLTYAHFGENDFLVNDQRGLVSILKCAAKNVTSKIQLGRLVTNIEWSDECVCASVEDTSTGTVSRMCGNYGIYTFSLGVLQEWVNGNPSKFSPSFPPAKAEAINHNAMAYYLTVFLEFPDGKPFWDTNVGYILRTDPVRGRYPLIQRLDDRLPGNPNMLLVHITGDEALRLGNGTNTANETAEEIMISLRQIYGEDIPDPTNLMIPSWISDPLYRGMYSYFRTGYTDEMHAELIKPEGRLYISGDHTDRDYHSFYHGAYLSGKRTANDIIERRQSSGAGMIKAGGIVSLLIFQFFILLNFMY